MHCRYRELLVKVILTVVKQLKQLQRKPRKNSEASVSLRNSDEGNSSLLIK